jgi:hypothetical protein
VCSAFKFTSAGCITLSIRVVPHPTPSPPPSQQPLHPLTPSATNRHGVRETHVKCAATTTTTASSLDPPDIANPVGSNDHRPPARLIAPNSLAQEFTSLLIQDPAASGVPDCGDGVTQPPLAMPAMTDRRQPCKEANSRDDIGETVPISSTPIDTIALQFSVTDTGIGTSSCAHGTDSASADVCPSSIAHLTCAAAPLCVVHAGIPKSVQDRIFEAFSQAGQ